MNTHPLNFLITDEQPADTDGVRSVNLAAFGREGEADVVDLLREECPVFISIVAKMDDLVVGHILFTPVHIQQKEGAVLEGMGLAPMAVLPQYQGRGIGSALCRTGLKRVEEKGFPFVIVIGHPGFYSRFGFKRASQFGITSNFMDVPDEAFMIRVFDRSVIAVFSGTAYYRPEFDKVS